MEGGGVKPKITDPRELLLAIADAFESHPWTWGREWVATDASGNPVAIPSDRAVRFCIVGAVHRCKSVGVASSRALDQALNLLGNNAAQGVWNDAPGRTVEEVVAKLREIAGAKP